MSNRTWYYEQLWRQQRESASRQPQNECSGGCGWPTEMCHCDALANIFQDAVVRRELTLDECYGREVLRANGICPECHEMLGDACQCEDDADGA